MKENNKCKHKLCNCVVGDDQDFCSEICKESVDQDIVELNCDCGHKACE